MTYILAVGCSFTDPKWRSHQHIDDEDLRGDWPRWPEIVAMKKGMACKNLGRAGASSHLIMQLAASKIHSDDPPHTVLVQLSDWSRFSVYGARNMAFYATVDQGNEFDTRNRTELGLYVWKRSKLEDVITENLLLILNLIHLCKSKKIKLLIGQNHIGPIWTDLYNTQKNTIERIIPDFFNGNGDQWINKITVPRTWMNNPYFSEMEKHKEYLIGWPFMDSLGGETISTRKHEISDVDHHPNKKGQEYIAEMFLRSWADVKV